MLVTRTGLEPMLPPWKGGVLTAWPTGRVCEIVEVVTRTGAWLRQRKSKIFRTHVAAMKVVSITLNQRAVCFLVAA